MKTISEKNYKTHNVKTTEIIGKFVFLKCNDCGLCFVNLKYEIWSDDDICCKDYLIKNIIE